MLCFICREMKNCEPTCAYSFTRKKTRALQRVKRFLSYALYFLSFGANASLVLDRTLIPYFLFTSSPNSVCYLSLLGLSLFSSVYKWSCRPIFTSPCSYHDETSLCLAYLSSAQPTREAIGPSRPVPCPYNDGTNHFYQLRSNLSRSPKFLRDFDLLDLPFSFFIKIEAIR